MNNVLSIFYFFFNSDAIGSGWSHSNIVLDNLVVFYIRRKIAGQVFVNSLQDILRKVRVRIRITWLISLDRRLLDDMVLLTMSPCVLYHQE